MLLRTVVFLGALVQIGPAPAVTLPSQPLRFGAFTARFDPSGTFTVEGQGWPKLEGTWTIQGAEIELRTPSAPKECAEPARYRLDCRWRAPDVRADRGSLPDASRDHGPQRVAPGVRDRRGGGEEDLGHAGRPPAGEAFRAGHGQLAVVPRRPGGRCGGWPAAAGHVEPEDRRARALADADPGPGAFEPDRVGRSRVRDQRRQQRSEGDVPARTLRRRRRLRRSLDAAVDAVRARRDGRARSCGSASPSRARRASCATSSRPTPARRRRRTDESSSRRSARRASTPTTSTARCCGRPISAVSTSAPTTFRPSSGAPRARRSSGTIS